MACRKRNTPFLFISPYSEILISDNTIIKKKSTFVAGLSYHLHTTSTLEIYLRVCRARVCAHVWDSKSILLSQHPNSFIGNSLSTAENNLGRDG